MALWSLFLAVVVSVIKGQELTPQRFCEAYVQCTAVATLEERICIGEYIVPSYNGNPNRTSPDDSAIDM
ncbi:unnamed protein product [Heligmosomoides polygyrus]|uniref:Secreted protein n=1 Tax=Heligmosomoides polygyrus TaxID=6339 RepID=A0A183GLR5_HELPZ|nr:unnamed protein product [Heligmosomoides polygyrus]